jgi:branched-chain amino acid transport system ATP-binding protein
MLRAEGIRVSFGGVRAVDGVSLHVAPHGSLGIIGPNGSGKTTTFNVLAGEQRAEAGQVTLGGRDITGAAPHRIARLGLVRTFQNLRLFPNMTVLENVLVGGHMRQPRALWRQLLRPPATGAREREERARAAALVEEVGLADRLGAYASDLSYGQTKRLELARALNAEPRVLLLDEPTAGMNDRQAREILDLVRAVQARRGLALVVIEHNVPELARFVERMIALDAGRVIAEGRPEEVVRDPRVVAAYLGQDAA